jgi:hypothetical protein
MGLDADLYATKGEECINLYYWRKYYEIQIWMHKLADSKGAEYEPQDGWYGPVALTKEDLNRFAFALAHNHFTQDFFSLSPDKEEYEKRKISTAIRYGKQLLTRGYDICYSSSY